MAAAAFGAAARPPDILFLHDAGLNALAYREMLAPLGARFHVVAVDLRGHGRTTLRSSLFSSWSRLSADIIELMLAHFTNAPTLAGHGLGAAIALLVAGRRADLARGVCAIDPALDFAPARPPVIAGRFDTREAAQSALSAHEYFASWPADMLADYAEDACQLLRDGRFRLRSDAAHAVRAPRGRVWRALAQAPGPITILRPERRGGFGDAAAKRAALLRPDARIAIVEGAGAAAPFENLERVRAAIEAVALAARGER
ncbi:MAG: alpha/beta fold hydrolase [Hyphomonadaceae bacterium]